MVLSLSNAGVCAPVETAGYENGHDAAVDVDDLAIKVVGGGASFVTRKQAARPTNHNLACKISQHVYC
jgi:hypothetical protein